MILREHHDADKKGPEFDKGKLNSSSDMRPNGELLQVLMAGQGRRPSDPAHPEWNFPANSQNTVVTGQRKKLISRLPPGRCPLVPEYMDSSLL